MGNERIRSYTMTNHNLSGHMKNIRVDIMCGSIGDTGIQDFIMPGSAETQEDGIRLQFGDLVLDGVT